MYVVVDLDDTLAASQWRSNLAPDWDAFHAASVDDKPIEEVKLLINNLAAFGNTVIVCTTRPERFRNLTLEWLIRYGILAEHVWMRPNNDFRSSAEIKVGQARAAKLDPRATIIIDDKEPVVLAFQEAGFTVLQTYARQ